MYLNLIAVNHDLAPLLKGKDPALFHNGDSERLLRIHLKHIGAYRRGDPVPDIGPFLHKRLVDARVMRRAISDLSGGGPKAPGPGGLRLETLSDSEAWSLSRALGRSIREGSYRAGKGREVHIPKPGKPGHRTLVIQDSEDRVAARAALLIFQPVIDPFEFSPLSFGGRPDRDRLGALATALEIARQQDRWVWVSADIETAFDRVPRERLFDACRRHFPLEIVELIKLLSSTRRRYGIPQGSPTSPFLFNVFADHFIDRPWERRHAELPLLRYLDDLLIPCRTPEEAAAAYEDLSRLARSAGTPLKGSASTSIVDLRADGEIRWLGVMVCAAGKALRIAPKAFEQLSHHFEECHLEDLAPLRARQVVGGWLAAMAPCYPFEDRVTVLANVRALAEEQAFDELQPTQELMEVWSAAHARWRRHADAQAGLLPDRLRIVRTRTVGTAARCSQTPVSSECGVQ